MQTNDRQITELMKAVDSGNAQLPDFQRGWVWDDNRIKALIASVTNTFPVGAAMFLEYGNVNIRFKYRVIEGVPAIGVVPSELILDGQQRITSLYSSLYSPNPVHTRTDKGKDIQRFYYIDIEKALDQTCDRVDAIISVPETRQVTSNFGRDIELDLSTPDLEYEQKLFPLNIILDYIFVFPMNMGMFGAALATAIGSLTTTLVLLIHFIKRKNRIKISFKEVSFSMIKKVVGCGISTFLMEVASGFVIFIFNIQIIKYIGDIGIVVYGIISNCIIVGMALFNGVAQASQPIIATYYGAKEKCRVKKVFEYAMKTTILLGFLLFSIVFIFTKEVICIFVKADYRIINMGVPAVRMYLSSFCIMNINVLFANYFQSTEREKISIIISITRGFLLNVILVLSLPTILGGLSLWVIVPLTEIISLLGIILYIKKYYYKSNENIKCNNFELTNEIEYKNIQ